MRLPSSLAFFFAASSLAVDVRTVYEFPNPTWLENIAALRNGSLLVSVIGVPEVHIVNPLVEPATASLVASFPGKNAVLGMSELSENVFAVATGNMTPSNSPVLETFQIWKIDFCYDTPNVKKIADIPKVNMVNGMASLDNHTLLLADSWAGNIVALDTETGAYEVALSDASLTPDFNATQPLGVNGLKVHDGYVYYSNFARKILARVRVSASGKAIGPYTTLASGADIPGPDDLEVAKDGSVYLAGPLAAPLGDVLHHVFLNGTVETVAQGGAVAGATGVAFGRTHKDRDTVYLSTMGGFGADGKPKAGGRVTAVKLDHSLRNATIVCQEL